MIQPTFSQKARRLHPRVLGVLRAHRERPPGPRREPPELSEAANQIYPENLIRVEADELTYHLHIIPRTEVEKQFVGDDITVGKIPQVWNDKMDDYLGVRPPTDTEGCLQDIHRTSRFAGFRVYTVGSVLAAQPDAALRDDLNEDVDELIEQATGEPLTADYFIDYVEEKFGELYGI